MTATYVASESHKERWILRDSEEYIATYEDEREVKRDVMSRNAYDIMRFRQWGVSYADDDGWFVTGILGLIDLSEAHRDFVLYSLVGKECPFLALIEANDYYEEHIDDKS